MITLDDIAALPHGEGKAVAATLWNELETAKTKLVKAESAKKTQIRQLNQIRDILNMKREDPNDKA